MASVQLPLSCAGYRVLKPACCRRLRGSGRGTLFPQLRLLSGGLMDQRFGGGWRLVSDGHLPLDAHANATLIDLAQHPEAEGVLAGWMQRHREVAPLV